MLQCGQCIVFFAGLEGEFQIRFSAAVASPSRNHGVTAEEKTMKPIIFAAQFT
jgi:hypothetical protein